MTPDTNFTSLEIALGSRLLSLYVQQFQQDWHKTPQFLLLTKYHYNDRIKTTMEQMSNAYKILKWKSEGINQ